MKKKIPMLCYIAGAILSAAFMVKCIVDYRQYSTTLNSAPFSLWLGVNAAFLMAPAILAFVVGFIVQSKLRNDETRDSEETAMDRDRERDRNYIVTKNDWEIYPMPAQTTQFVIKRKFSDAQIARLKRGHLPEEMEDRWFYYYEDGKVYFHRSWSGNCIYIVELGLKTNKHTVTVNRDEYQYANADIEEDIETINYLLNV